MRASHRWGLVVGVALVTALAGCAPGPAPTDGPIAEPAPTPTPTYVQPAVPVADLPLDCADLLSLGFVQDHYTGDTVTAAVDQTSTPRGLTLRLFQQAGGLRCVWGGSGRTDGGYDMGLEIDVLGDGADGYAARVASSDGPDVAWQVDTYGDASRTFCYSNLPGEPYVSEAFMQCYGDVLVGEYWLEFTMTDAKHPLTDAQAVGWGAEQLNPVIAKLQAAGPARPRWVPPADAYDGEDLCTAEAAAAVAGGSPAVTPSDTGTDTVITLAGLRRSDAYVGCRWATTGPLGVVDVDVERGTAWALAGITADPAEVPGGLRGATTAVEVPGADAAFVADGESAWGALIVDGSMIEVSTGDSYVGADLVPLLTKIAARIGG